MTEKLDYYNILTTLIPGVLMLAWIPICFPSVSGLVSAVGFPDAFGVLALTAVAIFLGHIIQALSSMIEPLIYWTWGGRPSDRALKEGITGYLPKDSAARIKGKLTKAVESNSSDYSLFLFAIQRSDTAKVGRASRFNSLYSYHRALLVSLILAGGLLIASMLWGAASSWTSGQQVGSIFIMLLLLVLVWYRTKQRAFYYVREVLLTVEAVLDGGITEKE